MCLHQNNNAGIRIFNHTLPVFSITPCAGVFLVTQQGPDPAAPSRCGKDKGICMYHSHGAKEKKGWMRPASKKKRASRSGPWLGTSCPGENDRKGATSTPIPVHTVPRTCTNRIDGPVMGQEDTEVTQLRSFPDQVPGVPVVALSFSHQVSQSTWCALVHSAHKADPHISRLDAAKQPPRTGPDSF